MGSQMNIQFTQDRIKEGRDQSYSNVDIQSQLLNSQIASRGNQKSKHTNFRLQSQGKNFNPKNLAIITDETTSSVEALPMVPSSNKNKNNVLLEIYEQQLQKQKK